MATKLNTVVKPVGDTPDRQNEYGIDIAAIEALDDPVGYPFFKTIAQCTISQDWQMKKDVSPSTAGIKCIDRFPSVATPP